MSYEFITVAGFFIAIVGICTKVGRYVERIDRFLCRKEDEDKDKEKNDRR